jgi:anti-sigma factor RsiW
VTRDELEFSISQYLDGTLPEDQRSALEARLTADADAQAILTEDRALTDLLRSDPLPEVRWDRLAESISSAIDEQLDERVARASRWMRFRLPAGLAVAASALIAIGIAAHLLMHGRSATTNPGSQMTSHHVVVATLTVQGPQEDVPGGPVITDISIAAGGSYAKDSSLDPYADEIDSRPARIVIASGMEPDRPLAGSPF